MYILDSNRFEQKVYTNVEVTGKKVLLRTCFNVTTDSGGHMKDDTRYRESFPLIKELADKVKLLLIISHLGRPKHNEPQYSFGAIAKELANDLGKPVHFVTQLSDLEHISEGIYFLENVRFFPGEESKDIGERESFAKILTAPCELFINDAFADYRESASSYTVAQFLPSYVGPVFAREVRELSTLTHAEHPFVAILGGAKLSEKLDALLALLGIADKVLIGGAMAYTLLQAKGVSIGKSLIEEDKLSVAQEIIEKYPDKIVLPLDHAVHHEFKDPGSAITHTENEHIPEDKVALDIGPKTIAFYKEIVDTAKTIVWNGPLGVFEREASAHGTKEKGKAIAANTQAYKIIGGGDSIAAINKLGLTGFDHISTGGGAMLAFLAYDTFPTLDIILAN